MTRIYKLLKADKKGVKRQVWPETHVSAVRGLDKLMNGDPLVLSVNGKTGNVVITKDSLGIKPGETGEMPIADDQTDGAITSIMYAKLVKLIDEYEKGNLGGSAISLKKVESESES